MKIYNCDVCHELVYFENSKCLNCGSELGYLPVSDDMSVIQIEEEGRYRALSSLAKQTYYKKCDNYRFENVCNWMIPADEPETQCISCRLNLQLPDLSIHENRIYWHKLEIAKRRLVYSILRLGLPLYGKQVDPAAGLAFAFLRDDTWSGFKETKKVMTGHSEGLITINLSEASDAVREKVRVKMNERYRTLLGHFRHEIGHYYWSRLVDKNDFLLDEFRNLFGDERQNYNKLLNQYYKDGPRSDWRDNFVSAYASSHPWEDWAESWAHYLHMHESLETAKSWGLSVRYRKGETRSEVDMNSVAVSFAEMLNQWIYLGIALNSLNRSMGMADVYPFVLSAPSIKKMEFVRKVIFAGREAFTAPGA